jgi:hypothetical protein
VALGFLRWAWGWTPDQWAQWPVDPQERRRCWGETLLIVFASVVACWVLDLVDAEMRGHFWPAEVVAIRYWSITEWAPWIGGLTEALTKTYGEMIRVAITSSVLLLIWRRHPRIARGLLLLMPLLDLPKPETLGGFVWWLVYSEAGILLMAWLVLKVWRFNAVAIFLTYWVTEMCAAISLFLRKGGAAYRWEAAPLIALILVVLVAIWWSGKESVQPASPETQ